MIITPESDEDNTIIIFIVLGLLLVIGLLVAMYLLFFTCKESGKECSSNEDCCEDLECNDSICISPTPSPTVVPSPSTDIVYPNIVNTLPEVPTVTTCSDWDISNDCETGTTITPGEVIGNSSEECCRPLKCQDLFRNELPCSVNSNKYDMSKSETIGYDDSTCCTQKTCEDWSSEGNNCPSQQLLNSNNIGYDQTNCCLENTCSNWELLGNSCKDLRKLKIPNFDTTAISNDDPESSCCQEGEWYMSTTAGLSCDATCQEFNMSCEDTDGIQNFDGDYPITFQKIMDILTDECPGPTIQGSNGATDCPACMLTQRFSNSNQAFDAMPYYSVTTQLDGSVEKKCFLQDPQTDGSYNPHRCNKTPHYPEYFNICRCVE